MFQQNRHPANSAASSSSHHPTGAGNQAGQAMKAHQPPGCGPFKDLLDRVMEEYSHLQQQLHSTRMELEKGQQERESMQRYTMMYNDSLFAANMEAEKHKEIVKRLTGILTHVIPMLPQDNQGHAVSAVERAKAISPQELQTLLTTHAQQQQMAAMFGPAAAAAFNPAMMMAGMGLNMNIKPEEAMQAMFSSFFKSPMMGAGAGLPPPGMPPVAAASIGPAGPSSSSSVPPNEEAGRSATQPGRASSVLNNSSGGHSRPRSGSPSGTGTPNSTAAKRAKLEPEEGDGDLEIDVQNDDASSSAAPSHHTNGRTSQPPKGGHGAERDTASASSSRDSATPRSGKQQLSSTPCSSTGGGGGGGGGGPPLGPLMPPNDPNLTNFFTALGSGRFPANLNSQMSGLFGLPPTGLGPVPGPLGALAATTNGKSPAYAFKCSPGGLMEPVNFPADASLGPDVPKDMKKLGDLPHGDVVCAVTMAKDGRRVFTGGKGAVKMWDIGDRVAAANNSASSPSGDSGTGPAGDGGGGGPASNGGGTRAGSAEPWTPMHTFPCLKDSYIRSCKLFPDASTLLVGGETKTICVLDVEQGDVKMSLDCDTEACYALAISPDCRLCFSCCSNGAVVVWDLQSGERVTQFEGHSDGASCVDLSGDGLRLWTGGLDNTVRCWDIGQRTEVEKLTLESQIFSLGCCPTDDWVAVGMEDQNVQVLNTNRMGDKYLLSGHQSCVLSLKFAHNGKWFVSTGKDNVVNCWRTPYGFRLMKNKESSSVLSCDISADDRYLLTGSGDKKASLYELMF